MVGRHSRARIEAQQAPSEHISDWVCGLPTYFKVLDSRVQITYSHVPLNPHALNKDREEADSLNSREEQPAQRRWTQVYRVHLRGNLHGERVVTVLG